MNFNMFHGLVVLFVCFNAVEGARKRHIDRHNVCINTVNYLTDQMASCYGMFMCGYYRGYGAHCIPSSEVCDGHSQCDGGEDEAYCPPKSPKCHGNTVLCPDGKRCAAICNGIPECMPPIDEHNCDKKCKQGQVRCSDGQCAVVGDGKHECDDDADENCPVCSVCEPCVQCDEGKGEISCIHKLSGKSECVSTCDANIECAHHEDRKALSTCPLACSLQSIKCVLQNGRGVGCAPVCDYIRQCQEFDEGLGIFGGADLCATATEGCGLAALNCFIWPNTISRTCCGCTADKLTEQTPPAYVFAAYCKTPAQ